MNKKDRLLKAAKLIVDKEEFFSCVAIQPKFYDLVRFEDKYYRGIKLREAYADFYGIDNSIPAFDLAVDCDSQLVRSLMLLLYRETL